MRQRCKIIIIPLVDLSVITFIYMCWLKFIQAFSIPADQSTTTVDLFANGDNSTCIGRWLCISIFHIIKHTKQSALQETHKKMQQTLNKCFYCFGLSFYVKLYSVTKSAYSKYDCAYNCSINQLTSKEDLFATCHGNTRKAECVVV